MKTLKNIIKFYLIEIVYFDNEYFFKIGNLYSIFPLWLKPYFTINKVTFSFIFL